MTGKLRYLIVKYDCSGPIPRPEFLTRDETLFTKNEWAWARARGEAFVLETDNQREAEEFAAIVQITVSRWTKKGGKVSGTVQPVTTNERAARVFVACADTTHEKPRFGEVTAPTLQAAVEGALALLGE